MFRGAIPNTHPISDDSSADCRYLVVPWTWPTGARILLAAVAMVVGLGLLAAGRDVRRSGEPIRAIPDLVLDPNTAPPRALAALPHIGPALVERLVEARSEQPFASLDDLKDRVRGIGPVTLARIAPYLRIEPVPGLVPEAVASSVNRKSTRKPRASRRRTAQSAASGPRGDQTRLASTASSSENDAITSPAR